MIYLDDAGRARDDETGHFASMLDYLNQLMEEVVQLEALTGEQEEEGDEEYDGDDDEPVDYDVMDQLDLDDFPDYELDVGDEVEFTVDLAYDETT